MASLSSVPHSGLGLTDALNSARSHYMRPCQDVARSDPTVQGTHELVEKPVPDAVPRSRYSSDFEAELS